ncbi:hypothetical protein BGZ72_001671 [Mortierella alpina]|nr:hypothetical protein BGZ72_001671 [Mortierella alpina]
MLQYSLATSTYNSIPMDPTMANVSDSAVVWSTARSSMLIHGGMRSSPWSLEQRLREFVPDEGNGKWALLSDKGDIPAPRRGHCLVPAYGGSKMILFGGLTESGEVASSGIYSLDIPSLSWTKLTDPGVRFARGYHACAVTNDMFVSWGGSDGHGNAISNNVTLVYNLKKNIWQATYSPAPEEGEWIPPYNEPSSLSLTAIIGIAAGSIVIVLIVGYVFYRRRQRQRKHLPVSSSSSVVAVHMDAKARIKRDTFQSLKSLSDDGTEIDLKAVVGVPHKQQYSSQPESIHSHSSVNTPATAYHEHFYDAPVSHIGEELDEDETISRPNEIMVRSPQAIIDTSGYQDCTIR